MATKEQIYRASILINSEQAINNIAKLKQQIADVKKRGEKAFSEGKLDVWKAANKEADALEKKLAKQEKLARGFSDTMKNLSSAKAKELRDLITKINKELDSPLIKKGSQQWNDYVAVLKDAKKELRELTEATQEHKSKFAKFTDFLNKNWGAFTQIIGAISGLSLTIRKSVQDFADMEEVMADVRKYSGLSKEEVRQLNEEFKMLDTRTSREELNELAGAAGRLGIQSREQILEFVKAADKIGVALGDDLGEGAVDQIGKLAMAFGEDENMGLNKAMLATGSAINELAQNSSAKAGYLVDFTARVAGFGKQMGLTQAQIMGFGAVMDENMLRDEMASTAFGNMLTKMQTDTAKFAKIAGMDLQEFTDMLNNNANQAILTLADSLKKADPQTMMKMLDDMGLDGARAVGVLSTMADKIDDVRERQKLAKEAYEEGNSVVSEFNEMNNTVQARLDKCKKAFKEVTVEMGEKLLPVVKYTITGTGLLIKALSAIVNVFYKFRTTIASTSITMAALVLWKQKDVIWSKLVVFWNEKIVGAWKKLIAVMGSNPWSAAIVGIAALAGLIIDLTRRTDDAAKAQKALSDIQQQAKKDAVEQEQKIRLLIAAAKDETLSLDERKKAINKLNEIIPNYNAQIDETTGKYKENKEALDDYLKSLVRQYEIEGAREKLKELGKQKADISVEKSQAQTAYDNAPEAGSGFTYTTSWGMTGNTASDSRDHLRRNLERVKQKEATVDAQIEAITGVYGKDLEKAAITEGEGSPTDSPTSSTTPTTYVTDAERRKQEAERKKREAEEKKRLKEQADAAKASWQEQVAAEMLAYRQGITTYTDYMEEKHNLTQNYYDQLKRIYGEDSNEYKKALLQQEQDEQDYNQWKLKQDDDRLLIDKLQREHSIRMQYAQQGVQDEEWLNEALFDNDIAYLKQKQNLFYKGSKEWMDIEQQIQQKNREHQFELEQNWMKKLSQYRQDAGRMDYAELERIETDGAKEFFGALKEQGKMTEEEYKAILESIRKKYFELSASQTADNSTKSKAGKALDTAKKAAGTENVSAGDNAATGTFAISQAVANQKLINEQLKLLYGADYENNREYQEAKRQLDTETMQQIVAGAQAAYSSINSLMSAASSYAQACSDLEVAKITANYDKQIAAAGKNSKKKERLEKQKDEAIAKAKTKANKKAMAMEIAQAVAQTAMGAISAYSTTMAGAPYPANLVLAPISAGIALAAGALQIATIKKQHEAEAAGYYEGGFTGGTRYRKEAGVVHEGEFVANHQAVNNRQLMPVFSLLDQAQRNNRVASLQAEDVTNVMGGPASQIVAPIVNIQAPDNAELNGTLVRETQDRLATQLEQGIGVDIPIDGENGVYRRLKRYENLLKNK